MEGIYHNDQFEVNEFEFEGYTNYEPTDEEIQQMCDEAEQMEALEMEYADDSDWREEIWRDHCRTESRAIARDLARYR